MNEYVEIVKNIIEENELDAEIVSSEVEDETEIDNEYVRIIVSVARKDYNRVFFLENYFDKFAIIWRQKDPELVGAEVGDLVLIYDEHISADEDCDVGLVSSRYTDEAGEVYYGCRYMNIALNDSFVNNIYNFEITRENYGGFKTGFLRVLSQEEAIDLLQKKLDRALEKEIEAAKTKHELSVKHLPKLIDSFKNFKNVKCDMIELDEELLPHSVDLKK